VYPAVPAVPVPERRAVASANRLGVGRLDLYQVHQPAHLAPSGAFLGAIRALQRAGLVGEVGVSNASLARWRATQQAPGASSVEQLEANVAAADLELSDGEYRALAGAAGAGRSRARVPY
jgi:aryl-alcohol dehydrogenase-like predicted oxidoreductase